MALLIITYDTATGGFKVQKLGSAQISDGAIVSAKIGALAIGTPHLAEKAVTIPKIDDSDPFIFEQTSAPMLRHLLHGYAAGPAYNPIHVDASGYQYFAAVWPDNTVTSSKIASGQVGAPHIYPGAVISSKIGVNAIGAPHILDGAITSGKIASGQVGAPHIYPGAVTSAKIGANVIGTPHLERFSSGKIIVGQGTGTNPLLKDQLGAIEFVIDGGGSVITSGPKGHLEIPFPTTINRVTLLGDQSGNITVDIWKNTYANFPPTSVDSICSGAKPSLSASDRYQDSVLSGWVRTIASGDILAYDANIASNIQRCTVSLGAYK